MGIYFEIQADDTERAANFYKEIFGWEFEHFPDAPVRYWHITAGNQMGGMLERPADTPPPECGTNAYVCSFEVTDFDRSAEKIQALGGKVALPRFPIPGKCWQGYFVDTEGNTFGIYEPDENAG